MSVVRHLRAIAFLPFMVTVVVPGLLVYFTGTNHPGWELPRALWAVPFLVGALLIALGLGLFVWTVTLFDRAGEGTLAPWDPTQRLVVQGPYRHVRNPMISGVLSVLLGEAALFGSLPLLGWAFFFFVLNQIYIPLFEEPGMERRFGDGYRRYRAHVPRWLPRLRAWNDH